MPSVSAEITPSVTPGVDDVISSRSALGLTLGLPHIAIGLTNVCQVNAVDDGTAAGTAVCYGSNTRGESVGSVDEMVVAVGVAARYGCGLGVYGFMTCWGRLPSGNFATIQYTRFVDLSVGFDVTCGITMTDSQVACFGE
jgi:hypothetical protein